MRTLNVLLRLAVGALFLAACAPGTDGIVIAGANTDDSNPLAALGDTPIEVVLPHIPVIALPDLSGIGHYDELVQERLGALELRAVDGVEVIKAECESGEAILTGDESSDLFDTDALDRASFAFEIDEETGASSYSRTDGGVRTRLETNPDGSGVFIEESYEGQLSIEASADGSGRYYADVLGVTTSVEADAGGAGVYYHQFEDSLTTITLGSDNSGALFSETPEQLLTIDARTDGSGDLYLKQGDVVTTLRVRPDGSWELIEESNRRSLTVKVLVDGSGQYRERGGAFGPVSLNFDIAGNSSWRGIVGPDVIVPVAPQFAVADRFPALGTLASFQPPCGDGSTILRFDSQVLFAVNEAVVLRQAAAVLAEVAPALIEAGRSLEINGHTDANGTDTYNQALSEERAQAVADALQSLGVDVELTINGLGESQPVAENYNADGSDNEAGQRQNRRVEIVIRG